MRPWWLVGCLVVLLLYFLRRKVVQPASGWDAVISADLLKALLPERTIRKVGFWIDITVLLLLLLAVVAMSGPSWKRLPSPADHVNDDLVIVLDLSLSMYVEDVSPSRFVRAKQKVNDLLINRDEGQTALVVYAGDAHVVTPLTDDSETIQHLLGSLEPRMMPIQGSNIDHALKTALELITQGAIGAGRILLLTDGIESLNLATLIWDHETSVHVVGVGTEVGGAIPIRGANGELSYWRNSLGSTVIAALDREKLRDLARITGGSYKDLSLQESDIRKFYSAAWAGAFNTSEVDERTFDQWHDAGYWLLIPIVLVTLLGLRRGILVVLILGLVTSTEVSYANWFSDLWRNQDQRAHAKLEEGNFEEAEQTFNDPEWQAISKYRQGNYEDAGNYFDTQEEIRSMYNLGNALALKGDLQQAIDSYDEVLALQPDHEDAQFNRDLLQQLLQQQEQRQQSEESSNESGDDNQETNESTPSEGEQNEQQESQDPTEPQDSAEPSDEESSTPQNTQVEPDEESADNGDDEGDEESLDTQDDEREAADRLARMLRRVPDDPGNLLENKFRHKTILRLRRGEISTSNAKQEW